MPSHSHGRSMSPTTGGRRHSPRLGLAGEATQTRASRTASPPCIPIASPPSLTPPPPSWSTRGDDALDRKSARMQRDYEIAAMMTASLRSALAHIKLNRPLSEVFDHHGHCDAD